MHRQVDDGQARMGTVSMIQNWLSPDQVIVIVNCSVTGQGSDVSDHVEDHGDEEQHLEEETKTLVRN